jgi:hypothetical protein
MKQAARLHVFPCCFLALILFTSQITPAQNCSSPPTNGWGSGYAAYAEWCSKCGGTPSNVGGVSCTQGPNWGKTGASSGADSGAYDGFYNLGYQLGYKFGQWLFGNGSNTAQAQAQQQAMMEEIARRQAEAERQHQEEEAARLAAMYQRLGEDLKHRDLPDLQLKTRASGIGVAGIQGLPGMYLDGGQNKAYGIPGLPGIYVGGPGQGSGLSLKTRDSEMASAANSAPAAAAAPASAASGGQELGLGIKTRDSEMASSANDAAQSSAPASQAVNSSQPAMTADTGLQYKGRDAGTETAQQPASASQAGDFDPSKMTPQQLADAADAFSKLPAEDQQRIMAAAQQNAVGGQPAAMSHTWTAQPAQPSPAEANATAATTAAPQSEPQQPAAGAQPGGGAMAQLQQESASSRAAAAAASPEAASEMARAGFDTPNGSAAAPPALAASPASPSAPASQPVSPAPTSGNAIAAGCSSAGTTGGSVDLSCARTLVVDPARAGQNASGATAPRATTVAVAMPSPVPAVAPTRQSLPASAPASITHLSDQQLQAEIARMRQKFVNMRGEFQADAQSLEEWAHVGEETQQEAIEAGLKCLSETLEKAIDDTLDKKQENYQKERKDAAFEAKAEEKWKRVRDAQWGLSKTGVDYTMSDQKHEETLETAESVLEEALEFVRGAGSPWINPAKCLVDCSYVAAKFYAIEQQIDIVNDNLGSATGKLKAQQALNDYYKDLIAEQKRRAGAAQ